MRAHEQKITSLVWNGGGSRLASGSVDTTVRLWSMNAQGTIAPQSVSLEGHSDIVYMLCWNPTSDQLLASASKDRTVRVWDSAKGRSIASVQTHGENINVIWSPCGKYIAAGKYTASYRDVHDLKPGFLESCPTETGRT